jgi:hypothetical protein
MADVSPEPMNEQRSAPLFDVWQAAYALNAGTEAFTRIRPAASLLAPEIIPQISSILDISIMVLQDSHKKHL